MRHDHIDSERAKRAHRIAIIFWMRKTSVFCAPLLQTVAADIIESELSPFPPLLTPSHGDERRKRYATWQGEASEAHRSSGLRRRTRAHAGRAHGRRVHGDLHEPGLLIHRGNGAGSTEG